MADGAAPLRVMVFLHSFEPGGVERVALRLCGAWARDPGIDLKLVMGREAGAMRDEAPAHVPRLVIPEPFPTAAWETIWLCIVLWRMIRAHRPDVLFAAGNSYSIVAVVMTLLFGRRCPPVVLKLSNDLERRDLPQPIRWVYHLWLRIQGQRLQRFTGLAGPMRAEIAKFMAVDDARIAVIEDPALTLADVAALAALGDARRPGPGRRYVAVGRLAAQKNFGLAITAFARAAGPDDTLTIVGEGGARAALERQVASLGLAGRVQLPGHGAVPPALAAADVFLLSSDYEGVPAVVIEALASGLPVVATDCAVSMRGLIGEWGSVVPVGDAVALAAAMSAQPALTATQRAAAATAMQAFTVERAATAYATLFRAAALLPKA
jgi:glycosyltransferase involved in cell wall biosynthesis